jgi:leucyl aminopeptidase
MVTAVKTTSENQGDNKIYLLNENAPIAIKGLTEAQIKGLELERQKSKKILTYVSEGSHTFVFIADNQKKRHLNLEHFRVAGNNLLKVLNIEKIKEATLIDTIGDKELALAFYEGMALGNYQFLKYFKDAEKRKNSFKTLRIASEGISEADIQEFQSVIQQTLWARTLVNEPACFLTAEQLSEEIQEKGKELGFKVEIFNKMKIESLRMGGLIAVNSGSKNPPTFTIMEYKHPDPVNKDPYVLVGKGVVFDTGGLNIKLQNMELMKCDMGGAAGVAGAFCAIAAQKLPLHIICLIPATENRPGEDAFLPGDIITMFDGTTVEVLNTDAEGRLILADALSYAKKFNPGLVIDVATLTGAAFRAIGMHGLVAMGNAGDKMMEKLKQSGNKVYERVVEFPFWEEYEEEIKSGIADLKNIGSLYAGAITAGKFLEHFTQYPWIHLDIAGPSFFEQDNHYRLKGGSGYTVRLLYYFFKKLCQESREE